MVADLRSALRAFLLADAAISSAVGGARVFPVVVPQGETRASVVYARISGEGDYHTQGPSGLARPRYQIDAYAKTQDEAAALANLVQDRIDGYRGLMGSVPVQGVFLESERDDYHDAAKLHRVSRDYVIFYAER